MNDSDMNDSDMNDMEYAIVCTLAIGKLHEQHENILSKVKLRKDRFTPIPHELSGVVARLIRNAKAVENICVIKHPTEMSELFNIITDGIQKTFEIE